MNKVVGFKTCFKTLDRRVVRRLDATKSYRVKLALRHPNMSPHMRKLCSYVQLQLSDSLVYDKK